MLFFYLVLLPFCWTDFIGAAVLPHGDFVYDPSLIGNQNGSLTLHKSAKIVGKWIESLRPDIIILSTPHGISVKNDFLIYTNTLGSGSAPIGQDLNNNCTSGEAPLNYKLPLDLHLSPTHSNNLLNLLTVPSSSLLSFGDSLPIQLQWAEIIPLSFISSYLNSSTCKTLIISMPTKRYTESKKMIPDLLSLGESILIYSNSIKERVLLLISADLAHTHEDCGPYGFSPAAEPFDKACGRWVESLDEEDLLVDAANLVDDALSCGFTGLVMLHGALKASKHVTWKSELLALAHPTYYGMMVAKFSSP